MTDQFPEIMNIVNNTGLHGDEVNKKVNLWVFNRKFDDLTKELGGLLKFMVDNKDHLKMRNVMPQYDELCKHIEHHFKMLHEALSEADQQKYGQYGIAIHFSRAITDKIICGRSTVLFQDADGEWKKYTEANPSIAEIRTAIVQRDGLDGYDTPLDYQGTHYKLQQGTGRFAAGKYYDVLGYLTELPPFRQLRQCGNWLSHEMTQTPSELDDTITNDTRRNRYMFRMINIRQCMDAIITAIQSDDSHPDVKSTVLGWWDKKLGRFDIIAKESPADLGEFAQYTVDAFRTKVIPTEYREYQNKTVQESTGSGKQTTAMVQGERYWYQAVHCGLKRKAVARAEIQKQINKFVEGRNRLAAKLLNAHPNAVQGMTKSIERYDAKIAFEVAKITAMTRRRLVEAEMNAMLSHQ